MDEKLSAAPARTPRTTRQSAKGKARASLPGKRFAFDLSTSARWGGIAVGIVRVERELARRAAARWGDRLDYCVYDTQQNCFRRISVAAAMEIIEGRLQLDFEQSGKAPLAQTDMALRVQLRAHLLRRPALFALTQVVRGRKVDMPAIHSLAAQTGSPTLSLRRLGREYVLGHARLYQAIQRLRGRSFSLEQIRQLQAESLEGRAQTLPDVRVPVREAAPDIIPLGPDLTIISGGLDWDHKNLRAIYALKAAHKFRYAAIIYDLIPLKFPHYVVPFYVDLLTDYFGELFWTADYGMCISECTERDVREHCLENGLPPLGLANFPLGGDLPDNDESDAELPPVLKGKRYALFVSTIEPRKNHRALYEAWDQLIQQGAVDPETCRLVFVGRHGWNTGELMHEIRTNPRTRSTIVILQGISDAALNALYRGAEFGLFPSRYEGYGLPLAEMLSHGLPCISSPTGSLPEVGGTMVTYKDPVDIHGWANAMAQLFSDPAELARQRRAVRVNYQPTSWDKAAELFFERLDALVTP